MYRETSEELAAAGARSDRHLQRARPALAPGCAIDICICSYRRVEIASTIAAVSRQEGLDEIRLRVIVADNTATGEMRKTILETAVANAIELLYVSAPVDNISIARNACLEAARADWIAFLDDDEIPAPSWLKALVDEAGRGGWDAVLGPVKAVYGSETPSWIRQGDFNSTAPVWVRGRINTAYTGNILFRRDFAERLGLRFRRELGKCGGEDEDFFSRFCEAGGRIGYARDALVFEPVPPGRASMAWLMRRNFRAGQSYGGRLAQRTKRRSLEVVRAFGKVVICGLGAALCLPRTLSRNRFLIRGALHVGVVTRLVGLREIDTY